MAKGLCLVGAFPPPIHGLSMINRAVRDRLHSMGLIAVTVNLTSGSLAHTWAGRISRLRRFFSSGGRGLRSLVSGESGILYIGLSAGYGQFYDCVFVLFARISGAGIYLHHHSFAYITRPRLLSQLLMRAAGREATHIVLCDEMARELRRSYPCASRTCVISNAVFTETGERAAEPARALNIIGFFGNISREKGIEEFLDVMELGHRHGHPFRGRLGGAFQDGETRSYVTARLSSLPNAEYVGPRSDRDRMSFYREVDALLFPSSYVNEADPLTIHEAMSLGVPVIAWERGCIKRLLGQGAGRVIERDRDYAEAALDQILAWQEAPESFREASRCALERHRYTKARYEPELRELLAGIAARF
jgi:glycosyltransferase involved in cell wall biosynthesis